MVIAARSPTAAPEEIVRNWNDSLATVDGVRGVDADDEANNNEVVVFIQLAGPCR
jgi:hypothetical protein